jgi:hypothetical protein
MKKSDLKTGMIIENGNGSLGKVMLGTAHGDVIAGNREKGIKNTWFPMHEIKNDLSSSPIREDTYTIVRVWEMDSNRDGASLIQKGKLLWDRSPIELTLDEIKEKLGHDFILIE